MHYVEGRKQSYCLAFPEAVVGTQEMLVLFPFLPSPLIFKFYNTFCRCMMLSVHIQMEIIQLIKYKLF